MGWMNDLDGVQSSVDKLKYNLMWNVVTGMGQAHDTACCVDDCDRFCSRRKRLLYEGLGTRSKESIKGLIHILNGSMLNQQPRNMRSRPRRS